MNPVMILATDGSCLPRNPGRMRIGVVVVDQETTTLTDQLTKDLKRKGTNSVCEYEALLAGLELCVEKRYKKLDVRIDSEFIYHQLTGTYRVKAQHLKPLWREAAALMKTFDYCAVTWHARETPVAALADSLSRGIYLVEGDTVENNLRLVNAKNGGLERNKVRESHRNPQVS